MHFLYQRRDQLSVCICSFVFFNFCNAPVFLSLLQYSPWSGQLAQMKSMLYCKHARHSWYFWLCFFWKHSDSLKPIVGLTDRLWWCGSGTLLYWEFKVNQRSQDLKAGWSCHSCNASCHAMRCHINPLNCPNKTHPSETTIMSLSFSYHYALLK